MTTSINHQNILFTKIIFFHKGKERQSGEREKREREKRERERERNFERDRDRHTDINRD